MICVEQSEGTCMQVEGEALTGLKMLFTNSWVTVKPHHKNLFFKT
jgi:hypothetical protein